MGLVGCGSPPLPEIRLTIPQLPSPLQACQGDPELPGPAATQKDVAVYMSGLWGAWQDCSATVRAQTQFWKAAQTVVTKP